MEDLGGVLERCRRTGPGIERQWDLAQQQNHFGEYVGVDGFADAPEGRGGRRVGVHHRPAGRALTVDPKMQI